MTTTDSTTADPSPLYSGEVIEATLDVEQTHDASITGTVSFATHGRFAVSFVPTPDIAGGIGPQTKVFASITETDGGGNPILGLADTKIYNVVPTPGRVTIRGEALWDSNILLRISLVLF
ncbi:MAG TPA: hypothetical protein VN767_04955 [Streptosporangiaceae bacterium]|jgi:hypothetical protein|nr:hypothetical protein [Streptosporangiaceae bacterium]